VSPVLAATALSLLLNCCYYIRLKVCVYFSVCFLCLIVHKLWWPKWFAWSFLRGDPVRELPTVTLRSYHHYHPCITDVFVYITCWNNPCYCRWKYYLADDYWTTRACGILRIRRLFSLIRKRLLIRLLPALAGANLGLGRLGSCLGR